MVIRRWGGRSRLAWLLTILLAMAALPAAFRGPAEAQPPESVASLEGRLLVAVEGLPDPRFARTVVLMVRHNAKGAFGLIVNRPAGDMRIADLLKRQDGDAKETSARILVHYGGPVRLDRGFVVHSPDYQDDTTVAVNDNASVTSSAKVLEAIASGNGPKRKVFMLGYAGWGPGQLESELTRNSWVIVPFDADIVFGKNPSRKWRRALKSRGLDL